MINGGVTNGDLETNGTTGGLATNGDDDKRLHK
jgi:hypothetical protein